MTEPVFSRRQAVEVQPEGSPRRYTIAPLTFQERAAFRAEMTKAAGILPSQAQLADALRRAVRDLSPGNAEELIEAIEAGAAAAQEIATGGAVSEEAQAAIARMQAIEAAATADPAYAGLLAAQQKWLGVMPYIAAQFALRGWEGEGLPAFQRVRGMVPAELIDELPPDEAAFVGWRASDLMSPNKVAEGNSASPSPSPEIPAPATAESSPTTAGAGS